MKYKTIKIPGHPRSGSHWINHLIDINFFDGSDYIRHYGGHPWGNEPRAAQYLSQRGQAVLYTYRNLDDAINSMYRMRHRFGLGRDNYEEFKNTPMKKMYNPKLKVEAIVDAINHREVVNQVDGLLAQRSETIGEYLTAHKQSWVQHESKTNFMLVCYDELVSNFQGTMIKIANFLGSDKNTFIDEERRVGWRERQDIKWEKPRGKTNDSRSNS